MLATGASHRADDAEQLNEQHSAFMAHDAPSDAHGIRQTCSPRPFGRHFPLQQSESELQVTSRPRHVVAEKAHRPVVMSQPLQQVMPASPVQFSPAGWHSSLSSPTRRHKPVVVSQMFEQQSALLEHPMPRTRHGPPPQTRLKQPSEQQSCALVHATPSAEQNDRHTRFVPMVGGSHRPLQHVALCVQVAPEAWHAPGTVQTCPMQKPEQQSFAREHDARAKKHADPSAASTRGFAASASMPMGASTASMLASMPPPLASNPPSGLID
jgi:hypothetical protein